MKHLSQVPEPPSKLRPTAFRTTSTRSSCARSRRIPSSGTPRRRRWTPTSRASPAASPSSRETEDAMTQVLAGVGISTAQTMVQRPRTSVPPPAPPAYRPPGYYDYEEPPRGRSIWPWLLASA